MTVAKLQTFRHLLSFALYALNLSLISSFQTIRMAPNSTSSFLSTTLQTLGNYFKPHRAEALQRIRLNGFGFILVLVFSNLLPIPSLQVALRTVISGGERDRWASDLVYKWFCILGVCFIRIARITLIIVLEVAVATVFAFNFVEGLHAVQYPRPPLPPYSSPAKTKPIFKGNSTPQRSFKILSPNVSTNTPYISQVHSR